MAATLTMVLMLLLLAGFFVLQNVLLASLSFVEQKVEVAGLLGGEDIGARVDHGGDAARLQSLGHAGGEAKHSLEIASGAIALAGIVLAALLFLGKRSFATAVAQSAPGRFLSAWWFAAWGFDWLYDKLFVRPYLLLCRLLGHDPIDRSIGLIPRLARGGNALLASSETGQVRWYATSIAGGAVLVLAVLLFLN